MTAQPSSQAEREDVAREVLAEQLHGFGELRRAILSGDDVTGDPMIGPVPVIAAMLAFSDREHATPRSMPEEVVEAPSEDWLADVIDDSLDMDWTGRVGARAIIARWNERHD